MKKVYVVGAYSADNALDVLKNIGRGEYYSACIFEQGMAPFCPWHDKSFVMDLWHTTFSVEQFYDYSITWLKVCDCMFLVPEYKNSKGTLKEIEIAKEMGIPIFTDIQEMYRWRDKNE